MNDQLNCQSDTVVYVIECQNCKIRYVGQTRQKLKDRLNQHRSDIKRKVDTTIANHFSQKCPNINFLKITPVEQLTRTIPEEYTFMKLLDNSDQIKFFQRELFWIKRLRTLTPHGLNKRQELPPPIPFTIKFSDQACDIAKLVKTSFERIQERSGAAYWRSQIVTAYQRNPNLGDFLVRAKIN